MANISADIIFKNANNTVLSFNRFNGLENYVSNSRSTADNTQLNYGLIAKTGSLEIHDKNNLIYDAIRNGLHEDGFDIKLYLDRDDDEGNGLIATVQATNDMSYNIFTKMFNVVFEDKLINLQNKEVNIKRIQDCTLLDLYNRLKVEAVGVVNGFNALSPYVENRLDVITVPFGYMKNDSLWNQLNKISEIGLLQIFSDKNGNVEVQIYDE